MATPKFTWDASAGRYRQANGRVVTQAQVRAAIDRDLQHLNTTAARLAGDLRSGRISLESWRVEMKRIIKHTHMGEAAIAKGGRAQMMPVDYGRVGQIVREEYRHLEGWVNEIKAGAPLDGRLQNRAKLYTQAGRATFHKVERLEMRDHGAEFERSVLHPADHCGQCVAEADAGFRPIGVMVPIGERECGRNCRCTVVYQRSAA
jgi:hypothetical protein